jgi:putative PIN family toxin of toxin-antitoxin system
MTAYMLSSKNEIESIVIDTNVFVGAIIRGGGINRRVLEMAFMNEFQPLMTDSLFYEYEDLMGRDDLFEKSSFDTIERMNFFDDFCSICRWVEIHYRWRPNLRDEGDNHVVELAIAGGAGTIVTWNKRDYVRGDMELPDVAIMAPPEFLIERNTGKEGVKWQH